MALAQNLGTVRAYCSQPFQPPGSASSSKNSRLHPHEGHSAEAQAGTLPIVGIAWGPAAGSADGCSLLISAGADGHLRGWALQGSQARAHNEQSPGQLPLAALFVVREPVCMQCACLPSRGQGMVVGTHPAGIAQAFALLQEYLSLLCCCSPSASIWTPSSLGPAASCRCLDPLGPRIISYSGCGACCSCGLHPRMSCRHPCCSQQLHCRGWQCLPPASTVLCPTWHPPPIYRPLCSVPLQLSLDPHKAVNSKH